MKFSAKLEGFLNGIKPILTVSDTGPKREYPDAFRLSLTVSPKGIVAEANNGNAAAKNLISNQAELDFVHGSDGVVTVSSKDFSAAIYSFDSSETLNFELKGGELFITPQSDTEKYQTVQIDTRQIEMPNLAQKFTKTLSLPRNTLIDALHNITWATGQEILRPEFQYWVLRVRKGLLRLVAGDGGRFAIYEISGSQLTSSGDLDFYVNKEQTPALEKVLALADVSEVSISEYTRKKDSTESVPDQIVINLGDLTLFLIGHDLGIAWPSEEKYLTRSSSYRVVTSVAAWTKEFDGIIATHNSGLRDVSDVHTTKLTFDPKKKYITAKVDGPLKALRKIPVLDIQHTVDETNYPGGVLEYSVETPNLKDMLKVAKGEFQLEFFDNKKPVIVRYYAGNQVADGPFYKVNDAANTKEQLITFFASYNK